MERERLGTVRGAMAGLLALLLVAGGSVASRAQQASDPPEPPKVAQECGSVAGAATPLPNSAQAIQVRKKLRILAIGSSMAAVLGSGRDGKPPLLEQILEHSIKGLDVEIVNRGFSGELAAATGERLKVEVALAHPDVVLWQVGANDAFALVPVEDFETSVIETIRWLKEHNVDIVLVGLNYIKQLAKNEHYQAIRKSLSRIVQSENVLRITRYEAMEVLERTMRVEGRPEPSLFGQGDAGFNCMAQYVAHGIAVGLYAKPAPKQKVPSKAP